MKIKVLLILIISILGLNLFAQTPDWQWAIKAGGSDWDLGSGIAIDDNGNTYVTGSFRDTATFGSYSLSSSGSGDIFIAKMDANGNWLWAIQAGGSGFDGGHGIAIDENGNSYVTGIFMDTATFGSYSLNSSGGYDIFVAKIDATGNWLWVTQAGESGWDSGNTIALDDNGNSYLTGWFEGTTIFGSYSLTSSGESDIFAAKMDANGNWQWATEAGGSGTDEGYTIATDDNGNSYVTGCFEGTATFGPYSLNSSGTYDIFVSKMDANGNWQWATEAGGSGTDEGFTIATDDNGNSYVTGCFEGTATFGPYSLSSSGDNDIFVAKMDTNGNWLWATKAGCSSSAWGNGIAIDDNGNSYVTGAFMDTVTFGSYSLNSSGSNDIFVAKIGTNGNWQWATKAGGNYPDHGTAIAIDYNGNSYVTGFFNDTATFGSHDLTSNGEWDIFIAKLGNETSVESGIIPTKMGLSNYPNPFNPSTTIEFSIQNNSKVKLTIHNTKGQKIKTLANDEFTEGSHSIIWNGINESGKSISSGVYLYKLNVNSKMEAVKKCLLLK
ncbi:MAG: SBBP repeat-containing protein [Candidatus Cloacimonetes bacterium]|nr:SBBP repeat-containing protein [Candidatus Cloacimonadota bacterium]